ncbi:hypothetical protein ACFVFI_33335 [Streptomyces sp. NPDC057705]|uniref:hypothetical protein n=1 Tax=Streptomyces sp. NPDC057705 TaxID=3346222 RepID=UPI0036B4FDE0
MDDQGGAGGVPLHHGHDGEARRSAPRARPRTDTPTRGKDPAGPEPGTTRAADTDEASRLDRPVGPTGADERPARWKGPAD